MNEHVPSPQSAPGTVLPPPRPQPEITAPPRPARRRSFTGRRIVGFGVLLLVLAGGGYWWMTRGTAAPQYTTQAVTRGTLTRSVTATGSLNPVLTVIVGTYVSGVVQDVTCDFNSPVKQGQLCAKIDPRPFQSVVQQNTANLNSARAQLAKDTADLAYAKLGYDRAQQLLPNKTISQDAADLAKNTYDKAQAQILIDQASIEQRQALLDAANINLGYTDIVSPVDGVVVSRNVTKGQTVAASTQTPTLFLMAADLAKMQVEANVSESDIGSVKEGQRVTFTVDAFPNRTFNGTVTQVRQSPQTVQNVVTYDVVIGVDNADLALKPGMTAATEIIQDQRVNALRVPDQALRYTPGGLARAATPPAQQTQPAPLGAPGVGIPGAGGAVGQPGGGPPPGAQGRPAGANGGGAGANRRPGAQANAPAATREAQLYVLRDGKPVAVPVTIGLDDGSASEIVSGAINAGDQVVVSELGGSARSGSRTNFPIPRFGG